MDWDDLKYVLAVARYGTYSAAAAALKVNQTTVTRRIRNACAHFGVALFDRKETRLMPTAAAQEILRHAERVEQEIAQALHKATDLQASPSGTVRITAVEGLITPLLGPNLSAFREAYPDIRLELIAGNSNLNLSRRDADIALRLNRPAGGTGVTRKLCDLGMALYGAVAGCPQGWLGYNESLDHLPEMQWIRDYFHHTAPILRSNSTQLLHSATEQGLGHAMLACFLADRKPELARTEAGKPPQVTREIWLIVHETARGNPAVRAVIDWIDGVIDANRTALAGL